MLEPLIVLTVLNCFFMFSSTVTTCALWWQYRSHRCCFRRDPAAQAARHAFWKLKHAYGKSKKPEKTKHETGHENEKGSEDGNDHDRSSSMFYSKNKRNSKQKSRSSSNGWFRKRSLSTDPGASLETMESWEIESKTRMSEASQTANDTKSAVVMEYSTVQKILQIVDDANDLDVTKLAIKDFNARHCTERKMPTFSIEPKTEPQTMPIYTTIPQT
ncbi:hypothetical protein WN55_06098 [Dufourea novaeangliae]|uniref:Uncharacterized protein n=1 Tax=Dufourea novaeangliae TaxID=178035 RepID=A0A154P260_DUFNO|nr:hypothetical protein WN55_06098 [Dufourea novaeangliae]